MHEVVIIGAGLSGLTTAYSLKQKGIRALVIEARNRPGGRINTLQGPLEMGATWMGDQHKELLQLIQTLGLDVFTQYTKGKIAYEALETQPIQYFDLPPGQSPSYRVNGGTAQVIHALIDQLEKNSVRYNQIVKELVDDGHHINIHLADGKQISAKLVINTIPPRLAESSIQFTPSLKHEKSDLMRQTHTWMEESIKYGVTYAHPFWKEKGLSGMGFSQSGILQEVHDHTNHEEDFFALKGFLNPGLEQLESSERERLVIKTLTSLFGSEAKDYLVYHEHLWGNDLFTSTKNRPYLAPHQNNGHELLGQRAFNGKLLFSGTETSSLYPGYMDGAVYSGLLAAAQVSKLLQDSMGS